MRVVTRIIVHHSLTADSKTVSWGAIERYHTETMGWQDIGYHAGVELVGDEYYAMIGRPLILPAAAVKEDHMNQLGLHVCCVGNYDELPPTDRMIDTLVRRVIRPWMEEFKLRPDQVMAHRDFAPYKTCPGKLFDMEALRARL